MELGREIWEMRKRGITVSEIHRKLGIPMQVINETLESFISRITQDAGRAMEHYRSLDDSRIEDLVRVWLPIATGGPVEVQKKVRGELVRELDYELPLKASYLVVQAIVRRIALLQASQPAKDGAGKDGQGSIVLWLQQVLPTLTAEEVNRRASRARQTLVLEMSLTMRMGPLRLVSISLVRSGGRLQARYR